LLKILVIIVLAIVMAAAGGVYLLAQRGFSARTQPSAFEASIVGALRDWAVPARYRQMPNPVMCSEQAMAEGRAHWADHCATCHANNGSGESMLGRGMYPKPPDMRQPETQRQSDSKLYYTIKNGILLSGMPAFGDPGDQDTDTWKLVCFVRQLPRLSFEQEQEMKKLNPKSPEDLEEEREEEQFLNGGGAPAPDSHHHHHQ
jgi:mono/diheme cytochrome c family protein